MDDGSRPAPRVGLALIAKNEEANLPTLLASVDGAFDRVVLLDTGSTDDTVKLFKKWGAKQRKVNPNFTYEVGDFEWCDDFAIARTRADELCWAGGEVDWLAWADCDDEIVGAQNFRALAANAAPNIAGFLVDYDYARAPDGNCVSYLRRERLVRAGSGTWQGRVHEAQIVTGGMIQAVDPAVLLYVHRKSLVPESTSASNARNLVILNKWVADEPNNARVLSYLGVENAINGDHETACIYYNRYLAEQPGWDDERAQVHARYASSLIALGKVSEAIPVALEGQLHSPRWTDNHIRLAECYLLVDKPDKAEAWARIALEFGPPQGTLLIVNPTDYSFGPRKILALAMAEQNRQIEAIEVAKEALAIGYDPELAAAAAQWQQFAKRERTAQTFAMCAEQLIGHDEQLKALTLLVDCVPVFAQDHPRIVGMRSMLRERISWAFEPVDYSEHYVTGGSKPEDMIPDDHVDNLCSMLPRTNFLLDGILEQLGVE